MNDFVEMVTEESDENTKQDSTDTELDFSFFACLESPISPLEQTQADQNYTSYDRYTDGDDHGSEEPRNTRSLEKHQMLEPNFGLLESKQIARTGILCKSLETEAPINIESYFQEAMNIESSDFGQTVKTESSRYEQTVKIEPHDFEQTLTTQSLEFERTVSIQSRGFEQTVNTEPQEFEETVFIQSREVEQTEIIEVQEFEQIFTTNRLFNCSCFPTNASSSGGVMHHRIPMKFKKPRQD